MKKKNSTSIKVGWITLISIFLLSVPIFSYAQEIEWQTTFGGSNGDFIWDLRETTDGGYITVGTSSSPVSCERTSPVFGGTDIWVVKLNNTGAIQWQKTYGGSADDPGETICLTSDGGYIIGGSSMSGISGNKTEAAIGSNDVWIIKIDSAGNIEWQNTIGGVNWDQLVQLVPTIDGGYACGVRTTSGISGDKTMASFGMDDYWMLKLDSVGAIQWQKAFGGTDQDIMNSVIQTSDGGYLCGGSSKSGISGNKTEANLGDSDAWILKLDPSGNIEWQNTLGGTLIDFCKDFVQTSDGNYVCAFASRSNSSPDKSENSNGFNDYWIVKLDVNGNIIWENSIGGFDHDTPSSIEESPDMGFIVGGTTDSKRGGDFTDVNYGWSDVWLVKLDSVGNIVWQNAFGGNQLEQNGTIRQTSDGGFIHGCGSWSQLSGDKTANACNDFFYDNWVVKLTSKFNSIYGNVFIDLNSNNIKDSSEPIVQFRPIVESQSGRFTFTDDLGDYFLSVLDSGNFEVIPPLISYYAPVPNVRTVYFNGIQQSDTSNNFAFQPTGILNDLEVIITPVSNFRSGMQGAYHIECRNVGTTTLIPVIKLDPSDQIVYDYSIPPAVIVTTDSIVWNPGPLAPFESADILVIFDIPGGLPNGYPIISTILTEPLINEAFVISNYDTSVTSITGSYDPNDIIVNIPSLYTFETVFPPYLEYLIRFQNTGNDTAFTVMIGNILSEFLDVPTLEVLSSSHPLSLNYSAHSRLLRFTFNNILLPDSGTNEPLSHGFVKYRIKTNANLAAGDTIKSFADIYFDLNDPVRTNTAITRILMPTSLDALIIDGDAFSVFPNPTNDKLTLELLLHKPSHIRTGLYDIYGRRISEKDHGMVEGQIWSNEVDVSSLNDGVYFIRISGDIQKVSKFVKY